MEALFDSNTLSAWLLQYGSITLFALLALGILALPVPEEMLMIISGILMHQGKLVISSTVIAALLGAICGISMSYLVGRTAGHYLMVKYGRWVGITERKMKKAHQWFERFGKWMLLIGYFIPGVRHFTGLIAGTSELAYKQFSLFAYVGALMWVSIFLLMGYFFGPYWVSIYAKYKEIEITFDIANLLIFFAIVCVIIYAAVAYFLKKRKQ